MIKYYSALHRVVYYSLLVVGTIISGISIVFLWIISPIIKIKIGGMLAQRMGHLALNTDLFFRRRQIFGAPKRTFSIFIAGSIANRQLFTMWKRHANIIESRLLRGLFYYSEWLWKKTPFYEPLDMNTNEYFEYQAAGATLKFTPQEEERGRNGLKKMGIDPDHDWFVCIFTRDSAYLKIKFGHQKDWSYHDFRNADINTFHLAIQSIIDRGGTVLRMGQHVNQSLEFRHPKAIDYATRYRDDFMDIYLAAKCRFFLGTTSGICDLPMIFDTPRITTNAAPPVDAPKGKRCLFIPKKIKVKKTGHYLSYAKFIADTTDMHNKIQWYDNEMCAAGYEYENNSPEEILDVTNEMMDRLDGKFQQTEEDRQLQESYFNLFPKNHWAGGIKTPIGRDFLRKNHALFEINLMSQQKNVRI